ncbi:glycosyltransferase family 2 protein [Candidatus Kuenenbacteria bacterium]|nr:glycosyltransferase family 2 protein [Candidatus Kuenenbacteria bacterium]
MQKLSIVIPIYNEAENLPELFQEIKSSLASLGADYEIIAVNDGSTDNSFNVLKSLATADAKIKVISFSRNFGQTAALSAGFVHASGEVIIPLDADLQNDPHDIPLLLAKLSEGYDIVSGWRKNRQDKLISRKIPSRLANSLIGKITKVKLHDYGCTMKAYKRESLAPVRLYGEMHRFIPALAAWHGAKITEVVTNHRPRKFGQTKYGIRRTFKVILDLLTVKFLTDYSTKPMHFFGKAGFYSFSLAFLSGFLAVYLRLFHHISLIITPLPLLTVFLMLVGLQFILMGLLAEMITRTYYETQNKPTYFIKEKINF